MAASQKIFQAEKVRQAQIVLRARWQRWLFFAGLAGAVLLVAAGVLIR